MPPSRLALAAAAAAVIAVSGWSSIASAQVCTQSSPGLARVELTGGTAKIHIAAGSIPRVNGVSCGFAATSIDVIGAAGNDTSSSTTWRRRSR